MCDGNAALRARLEALLAAHAEPDNEVATQLVRRDELHESQTSLSSGQNLAELGPPFDEAVGQTLERYKLLERIGEGGCGVVYVAEQTEPVRRRVALKVIKLGMDTKQVVARFEAERQALAMMDHPNIAKVLDAGTTDVGRPFFVMELVPGIRITDHCDQAKLNTKDRLDLFIKMCHPIQHAHQKGIIHRDIKPSNILVTLHDGVPVPKVIDFGIAKATLGSDQITTKAKRRSIDGSKLLHQLKRDLNWIVMKCLEKDRTRRYETAYILAADLKRHLDNEVVTARPAGIGYKMRKFVRRNRGGAAAWRWPPPS